MGQHTLSNIHPDAKIGKNVVIDSFVTISKDVEIGDNTWIGPNVVIMDGARIGKNCQIFPGAVISAIPQDLKYNGEPTLVVIGDNNIIREYVTINKGTVAEKGIGKTVLGNNNMLMAYTHVAHDCVIGNHCVLANGTTLAGHITIHDWAITGGLSAILQFSTIGSHVILAGGSLVNKDVPPFVKAARFPISYDGVNIIGLKRRGFSDEKIQEIQDIYRTIYQKGLNVSQAMAAVEQEHPVSPERDEILNFIKNSSLGIMKNIGSK